MIDKQPRWPDRRRPRTGRVAFLEHRCLREGFWSSLSQPACRRDGFLVLGAARTGLS